MRESNPPCRIDSPECYRNTYGPRSDMACDFGTMESQARTLVRQEQEAPRLRWAP